MEAGQYFVTPTTGLIPRIIRVICHAPVNHAGVYVGHGLVVEAQPGGARLTPASSYPKAIWSTPEPAPYGRRIAQEARRMIGTPYSWLDIAALGYAKVFGRTTPKWVRRRLSRTDRLICSQLVDLAHSRAGIRLFTDDRPSFDVTPGDLYELIESEW